MTVKRLTCLWPGLARLWFRGEWSALLVACAFAALVNGLIVTTLLWTEVAPDYLQPIGWIFAALWWLGATGLSLRKMPETVESTPQELNQGLFTAAQTEYLKGNWIEAEACVRRLLRQTPRDVESLLLLATIHRRTRRHDEARGELQQIARLDAADRWQVELRKEREMLRRETQRERIEQLQHNTSPFDTAAEDDQHPSPDRPVEDNSDSSHIEQTNTDPQATSEQTPLTSDEQQRRHAA